jgi:sterol desaturase/sphingolipid hydroxylase (fatty acid hydroxylase superfamily)
LPLTLVDYLYYWNHRLLHTRKLWPLHLTHHTTEEMHWSVSSRNSQWTCFFLVYIWFQILIIYFLDNPFYYSLGMTVNGVLDLWRHSGMRTPKSLVRKIWFLVSPEDHEWHHRFGGDGKNFGANLSLWDRMHGTYEAPQEHKPRLGIGYRSSWVNEFWRPWRATKPRNSL